MYIKTSFIKRKIRGFAWRVFTAIENNGDCNFEKNGEEVFINNLFQSFENSTQKVVFDIGANIGDYAQTILDKSLYSKVDISLYLFEPTQSCFSVISKKFSNLKNIKLNNFGVSDKDDSAVIYYDKDKSGLASLYQRNLDSYNLELNESEEIKLRRLDHYIEEQEIQHIDFIKIDIEGHELKAFDGFGKYLNSDFIDYIQFEYGGANLDSHTSLMEMYKFLVDRGFKIAKVMPNGLEVRTYEPYMDNFNYSNYVAISKRLG